MTKTLLPRSGFSLAAIAITAIFAAGAAHSMVSASAPLSEKVLAATEAEQLFADAPDGVDPMVTGPVSVSFKKKQHAAGCAEAKWPEIPVACYPQ
ncbi:hypothetical protein ASD50_19830 [Mesorhizobium sp. Root552]|jgi:hypothetical protein|uniref:hypothetical protein n=1 Tax=Mesorhizobium sp. Root552 TaxID=1736555 RepID=UPI0006F9E448|nr:hypothetical protein [Mesorhizobium sp. Root552]KQZ28412.1 hypothetical protein ASD50_19830 [Mesorhizobium sp. Root552]